MRSIIRGFLGDGIEGGDGRQVGEWAGRDGKVDSNGGVAKGGWGERQEGWGQSRCGSRGALGA